LSGKDATAELKKKTAKAKVYLCFGGVALVLGTGLRLVVSVTPRRLYPQEKSSQFPLDMGLAGSQNRTLRRREKSLAFAGNRTPVFKPVVHGCTN
jgi:hypothetical protein